MTPEEAKTKNDGWLRAHCVPVNDALPLIESPSELSPQGARAVGERAIVLCYVIGIGFDAPRARLKAAIEEYGLYAATSEIEKRLLAASNVTQQEKVDATWLTECVQALGWCLDLVRLDPFRRCDDDLASHFPAPFSDPTDFIANATLRPFDELYQQADLHYRLLWAARDCRLKGLDCPVEEGVIQERRKALDWVIGVGADWDEIPMDT